MENSILLIVLLATCYITYTDIRSRIIPDKVTLPLFFSILLIRILQGDILYYIPGFVLTAGLLFTIAYFSNGGIGGGDIKLMAVFSVTLPFIGSIAVLLIAQIFGLLFGFAQYLAKRKEREIPLGPGFALGYVIYIVFLQ